MSINKKQYQMIVLNSIIDGMQVICGGFIMNIVLFLSMLLLMLGRLPDYGEDTAEDTARTSNARFIYYMLLCYHLSYGLLRYLITLLTDNAEVTDKLKIVKYLFLFLAVYLNVCVSEGWVFRKGRDWSKMDNE